MAQLTPSQVSRFAKLTATATLPVGGLGGQGCSPHVTCSQEGGLVSCRV